MTIQECRKELFKDRDWALGVISLKETGNSYILQVGNRDISFDKKGKFLGSGMGVGKGYDPKLAGDFEKAWKKSLKKV